ncbi:MAG: hypothetical protein AAF628_06340 [Planctomycetota bacterium]
MDPRHEPQRPEVLTRACRQFLRELPDHLPASSPIDHAASCAGCASRLATARRHAELLAGLPRLSAPGQAADGLADVRERLLRQAESQVKVPMRTALQPLAAPVTLDAGLDDLRDRLAGEAQDRLGGLLRHAMRSTRAPADAVWQVPAGSSELSVTLRGALSSRQAPAWMRRRIQSELLDERARPQDRTAVRGGRVVWSGLAAAAAILAFALLDPLSPAAKSPSLSAVELRALSWEDRSTPIDPTLSLQSLSWIGR